jgi:hypothetical protein
MLRLAVLSTATSGGIVLRRPARLLFRGLDAICKLRKPSSGQTAAAVNFSSNSSHSLKSASSAAVLHATHVSSPATATLLDGAATSELILRDIAKSIAALRSQALSSDASVAADSTAAPTLRRPPGLAVLLATSSRDSQRYVERKADAARKIGFHSRTEKFDETTVTEDQLLKALERLNADPSVDGILVQLPLPDRINQARILAAVTPTKDVDCFHPHNVGALALFAARESGSDGDESNASSGPLGLSQVKYHPWERRLNAGGATSEKSALAVVKQDAEHAPENVETVYHVPCTPKACLELLDR